MGKVLLRADHIGSLLRSDEVKNARKSYYEEHTIDKSELTEIENQSIKALITNQEHIGLKAVTDGEQRRSWWHYDFMDGLDGMKMVERDSDAGMQFAGVKLRPIFPTINSKVDFPADHPHFTTL